MTDPELLAACRRALTLAELVPHLQIQVVVTDGWVQLEGFVGADYQRAAAVDAVQRVPGVLGTTDDIEVRSARAAEVRERIASAFKRAAELEARGITIELRGNTVILSGTVQCEVERREACAEAARVGGVAAVEDHLVVAP